MASSLKLTLLLAALLLAGCGFQLRGAAPVSPGLQPLALHCAQQVPEDLCRTVTLQLTQGGVALVAPREAEFHLRLTNFREERRASAVTLQAAAAEYELRQRVYMDVIGPADIPVMAETEVRAVQNYRYDETNVLAKRREEAEIRQRLHERLAQQLIFRLAPLDEQRLQQRLQAGDPGTP
ncbi:MAG: LPS assembly lipoprotein LptE [Marinobacter sp.]|nr:LPS assembly lipoprotein LptE [Marinobacter sp.]